MDTKPTRSPRFDLSRILVIDLEATCWQGPKPPDQEPEIIEIGNAILHVPDLQVEPGAGDTGPPDPLDGERVLHATHRHHAADGG